jgi:hypothetical protein
VWEEQSGAFGREDIGTHRRAQQPGNDTVASTSGEKRRRTAAENATLKAVCTPRDQVTLLQVRSVAVPGLLWRRKPWEQATRRDCWV